MDHEAESADRLLDSAWRAEADRRQAIIHNIEFSLATTMEKARDHYASGNFKRAANVLLTGFAICLGTHHECDQPSCDIKPRVEAALRGLLNDPDKVLRGIAARRKALGIRS